AALWSRPIDLGNVQTRRLTPTVHDPRDWARFEINPARWLADLTKLDRHSLGILASQALKSPHVVVWFVARFDAKETSAGDSSDSISERSVARSDKELRQRYRKSLAGFTTSPPAHFWAVGLLERQTIHSAWE